MLEDRNTTPNYDLQLIREEMEERWRDHGSGHRLLAACLALVTAGVAALAWLTYPWTSVTPDQRDALAAVPSVSQSVDGLTDQLAAAQARLDGVSAGQEQLAQRLETIGQRAAAAAKQATRQAEDTAAKVVNRLRTEWDTRISGLTSRLSSVEQEQASSQTQIASLRQDLTEARRQIEDQTRQLAALRGDVDRQGQQTAGAIAAANRQVAAVAERQARDRGDFDAWSTRTARRRVDFEVSKGQPREVVPGVTVGVHNTNVSYQRVNGWVSTPGRRVIWLRDHRVQEPVALFSDREGRAHELVLTRVSRDAVIGYVVVPAEAAPAQLASSAGRE
jgi:predicted  nucleic acid-binding Zn-ribbon protein